MNRQSVLLATSLVEGSTQLLRTAHQVARALGVPLDVVYAIRQRHRPASRAAAAREEALLAEVEETVRTRIARQITRLAIPKREMGETIVRRGQPYQVILEEARRLGARLIVLRGSDRGRLRIGSTTDRVLRQADVPVLIVRGKLRLPLRSALFTADLAPLGVGILRCGASLLRALGGRRMPRAEVLHAVAAMHFVYPGPPVEAPEELAAAEDALSLLITQADGAESPIRRRVVRGDPVLEILRRLRALRPDVVVLGTHGTSGLERFLLGSVAADIARSAPCSALVIPPEAAQASALREIGRSGGSPRTIKLKAS
jgi:nucleotide-binding universal stress UspA family protein